MTTTYTTITAAATTTTNTTTLLLVVVLLLALTLPLLVQRRPVFSSFSASPRINSNPSCTVRRHHTFEAPRINPSQSELNGASMVDSPPRGWKRSFSERIRRSAARLSLGEEIRLEKAASSADRIQDNFGVVGEKTISRNSTVIAKTVGGDVVVELTRVDDESCSSVVGYHASDLSIHEEGGRSTLGRSAHSDESRHLRVDTKSSTPEYRTFDSDERSHEAGTIRREDSGNVDGSFRQQRSPKTPARNCRRNVTRRRQAESLSIASGSMRSCGSAGSAASAYCDRRRESASGSEHVRTTTPTATTTTTTAAATAAAVVVVVVVVVVVAAAAAVVVVVAVAVVLLSKCTNNSDVGSSRSVFRRR